ncbi:MFS transporter [Metabacillus sediminilitoris]|uniref:MFS transporter n=1 Tax=Metabacillus sediminilitoris TaxID=2567941 RepID=A0A4V3WF46_9BACI|nr:MFS transporter [Metabacillus sediminilitoris]QGQ44819.1 MFS transporter [Metabacillus sediminilitoris]THF78833.1 MFS transporter [Metabacillus sediminilitoris]
MYKIKPKLWSFQFFQVIMITFLFFLCLHMLNVSFPVFVIDISHNPALGGMMTTAFMLAAIFTRPFISIFLHKINMKKTIIMTLIFIFLCILISYNRVSIPFLLFIRGLEGVGFGIITTLLATMATNIIPRERLGEGVGYFGMATSLGASLSPVLALSLFHSHSFNTVLLFTLMIVTGIFVGSLFIRNVHSNKQTKEDHQTNTNVSIFQFIFDKKALLPSILVFLLCVTFGGVFNFIDGLGREAGLGANVSLFFLIFMFVMLFIRPISGRIFDKKGHKMLIYPAGICGVIGLLLLGVTNNLLILLIAAVFYGVAYGTMHPTLQSWAVSQVEPNKKGTANAMILTCMDLGMAVGAPTLGMVAGQFGYKVMYSYTSLFIILLLIIYMVITRQKNSQEESVEKDKGSAINF